MRNKVMARNANRPDSHGDPIGDVGAVPRDGKNGKFKEEKK